MFRLFRANAAIFSTMSQGSKKNKPLLQTRSHWNGDWNERRMTFRCRPLRPLPLFSLHEWELPNFQDSGVLLIIQWMDENCIEMSSFGVYLEQHEADGLWHCSLRANHWLQWSCSFNIRLCQLLAARLNTEHTNQNCITWEVSFPKLLLLPNRHHAVKEVHHCVVAISLLSHFARQRKRVDRNEFCFQHNSAELSAQKHITTKHYDNSELWQETEVGEVW